MEQHVTFTHVRQGTLIHEQVIISLHDTSREIKTSLNFQDRKGFVSACLKQMRELTAVLTQTKARRRAYILKAFVVLKLPIYL